MHVIIPKQLIQFDLTGFCKTLVAILWNMDSCNIVTKTVWHCVKAIAPCLTSCIFASFGCWASLGKLGQGDSAGVAEVFPSWEQMGARLICVSTIRSPLGPPGTCGPTNANTNENTNTNTNTNGRLQLCRHRPLTQGGTYRQIQGMRKLIPWCHSTFVQRDRFSLDDSKVDRRSQIHFIASLDLLYSVIPPLTIWWLSVS